MPGLQTEFEFRLPKGYVDGSGTLHRRGTMRLATARDEIEPLRDSRVADADDPFLTLLVLSRVITSLGSLPKVSVGDVEGLFAADLAFLQDFYGVINFGTPAELDALRASMPVDEPQPAPEIAEPAVSSAPDERPADAPPMRRGVVEEVSSGGVQ